MKKITLVILLFVLVFGLSACSDQKYMNEEVTVIFFTANFGASEVESYFNVDPNTMIEEPEEPTRLGFAFDGWFTDITLENEWDFDSDEVGEVSIILYARWVPEVHDIIYDLNGGEMVQTEYLTEFETGQYEVLPIARLTGYTFVAWYLYDWEDETSTKAGDAGYQTIPEGQYEDLYLYAHYEPVTVRVTFTVNYPIDDEGPDGPPTRLIPYGSEIAFPILDDTAEYEFLGWNTRSDGTGTFYNNGDLFERTQRITLYGAWQLIE